MDLPLSETKTISSTYGLDFFNTAHNIYMDENGVAYIFGD